MKSYFRANIDAMHGYTPGEQPKLANLVKLNTNENPFPPSPKVAEALKNIDYQRLRLYSDPLADDLRDTIAQINGVTRDMVIAGNGSDDILTMVFRAFADETHPVAVLEPTYSLYPVLAQMQNTPAVIKIELELPFFTLPDNLLARAQGANLLVITRPNAPTGNSFDLSKMEEICRKFDGIVFFDEAYADFADDNCLELAKKFDHVIVSRTSSKSYSLAGLRLGYAIGHPALIDGLFKLKDSYNLDMLTQTLGKAAFADQEYLRQTVKTIRLFRQELTDKFHELKFTVIPSQANFLFVSPPDGDGQRYFKLLRDEAIIVRYFAGPVTGAFVRITVGNPEQNARLMQVTRKIFA